MERLSAEWRWADAEVLLLWLLFGDVVREFSALLALLPLLLTTSVVVVVVVAATALVKLFSSSLDKNTSSGYVPVGDGEDGDMGTTKSEEGLAPSNTASATALSLAEEDEDEEDDEEAEVTVIGTEFTAAAVVVKVLDEFVVDDDEEDEAEEETFASRVDDDVAGDTDTLDEGDDEAEDDAEAQPPLRMLLSELARLRSPRRSYPSPMPLLPLLLLLLLLLLPPEDAKLVTVSPLLPLPLLLLLLLLLLLFDEDEESSAPSGIHVSSASCDTSNALRLAALSGEGGGDFENVADAAITSPFVSPSEEEELAEVEAEEEVGGDEDSNPDGDDDNTPLSEPIVVDDADEDAEQAEVPLTLNPLGIMSFGMNDDDDDDDDDGEDEDSDSLALRCFSLTPTTNKSPPSSTGKKPKPDVAESGGVRDVDEADGERGLWLRHGAPSIADMQNMRFMYLRSVGDASGLRRSRSIVITNYTRTWLQSTHTHSVLSMLGFALLSHTNTHVACASREKLRGGKKSEKDCVSALTHTHTQVSADSHKLWRVNFFPPTCAMCDRKLDAHTHTKQQRAVLPSREKKFFFVLGACLSLSLPSSNKH